MAQYESSQTNGKGYKRITLLRVAHDSVISRDNFLSCFFLFVEKELRQGEDVSELSLSQALSRYANPDSWSRQQRKELETSLAAFSDYLVDNFFLPCTLYIPTTAMNWALFMAARRWRPGRHRHRHNHSSHRTRTAMTVVSRKWKDLIPQEQRDDWGQTYSTDNSGHRQIRLLP